MRGCQLLRGEENGWDWTWHSPLGTSTVGGSSERTGRLSSPPAHSFPRVGGGLLSPMNICVWGQVRRIEMNRERSSGWGSSLRTDWNMCVGSQPGWETPGEWEVQEQQWGRVPGLLSELVVEPSLPNRLPGAPQHRPVLGWLLLPMLKAHPGGCGCVPHGGPLGPGQPSLMALLLSHWQRLSAPTMVILPKASSKDLGSCKRTERPQVSDLDQVGGWSPGPRGSTHRFSI